ncbi:MAG TPA: NAD(P)H-dependent oxidoreductase subunit E, partial [Phycisphaerae bacterium]|nr:NAD(P)H-dependent oxidoreductase subunit E [Phycisphaerae bacterium]
MTNEIEQFVDATAARIGREADKCIPILQAIQAHWRWLPPEALARVCEVTEITAAQIAGVSTFYTQFRHRPMGCHLVRVCHGTACHVKGAQAVTDALRRALNLPDGEDTDTDGRFTLQKVACLGCCTLAPAVQIDEVTYGHLTPDAVEPMLRDFLALRERAAAGEALAPAAVAAGGAEVRVGLGSCCVARGSGEVWREARRTLAELGSPAALKTVGCV